MRYRWRFGGGSNLSKLGTSSPENITVGGLKSPAPTKQLPNKLPFIAAFLGAHATMYLGHFSGLDPGGAKAYTLAHE